jgi:hypothetical protein
MKVRATYQQDVVSVSQQVSWLEQGTGVSNGLLEVIVGWKKGMIGKMKLRTTYQQTSLLLLQQVSPLEQGKDISN